MSLETTGLRATLAAAALLAAVVPASAQQTAPDTVAVTERMQSHAAWHVSRAVSGHVGRALLGDRRAGAAAQAAPHGPVASATAGEPQWNAWIGPNVTWSEQDGDVAGNEGHIVTTFAGLDRRLGGRGLVGVLAGGELADFDTALLDGELETAGLSLGLYGGYAVTDVLVLDAMALYGWIDNDFEDRARSADYDSERLTLAANATLYLTRGRLAIRPKLGVAYTRDEQEAYRDTLRFASPETDVETVSGTAGVQLGYTVLLGADRWIEPFLGLTAVLEDSTTDPEARSGDELDPFDLRLSAGLSGQLAQGLSVSLSADVSGLARSDHDAVTVAGQLSLRF